MSKITQYPVVSTYDENDVALIDGAQGTRAIKIPDLVPDTTGVLQYQRELTNSDDIFALTDVGMYWVQSGVTPANGPNTQSAYILLVMGSASISATGRYVAISSTNMFYGIRDSSATIVKWDMASSAISTLGAKSTSVPGMVDNSLDLNNSIENGYYKVVSSITITNGPTNFINNAFVLIVMNADAVNMSDSPSDSKRIVQIIIDASGMVWMRQSTTNGFLNWVSIPTSENDNGTKILETSTNSVLRTIGTTNKYTGSTGGACSTIFPIPKTTNRITVMLPANATGSSVIAFLTSDDAGKTYGDTPSFSAAYPIRMLIRPGRMYEFKKPFDVTHMYALKITTATAHVFPDIHLYADNSMTTLQELPVLHLFGDLSGISKDNEVTLSYALDNNVETGTCSIKWQGSSSQRYVKKNYTIKFDTGLDGWAYWATFVNSLHEKNGNVSRIPTTSRWGAQTKFCTKANWIDPSAARNVVCARLWGQIVKTRVTAGDVVDNRMVAPNYGAIDGFPIEIRINGESAGLYTLNIPKDGWMFSMGSGSAEYVVSGESNSSNACKWKATALVDGTDYSIEYAPDGVETATIAASLNTAIQAAINASSDWETELAPYLDIDSVIDYFIFACCVNATDCMAHNILYGTYDGTKWFMSAYDLDTTFGVDPYGTAWHNIKTDRTQFAEAASFHRLAYLVYTYSTTKLKARYKQLRETVLSEGNVWNTLSNFIVDIPTIDYDADRRIWPSTPGTAVANMHQYMDYYRMHCKYLDDEIEAL